MEFGARGAGGQSPLGKPQKHTLDIERAIQIPTFLLNDKDETNDEDGKIEDSNRGIQPTLDLQLENTFFHNKHP